MQIRLATNEDSVHWNDYCQKQLDLPPLPNYEWLQVFEDTYGVTIFPIVALDENNNIRGLLPIYQIFDYMGNPNLYSLKNSLIADDIETCRDLVEFAEQLAQDRNAIQLTVTSGYHQLELPNRFIPIQTVTLEIAPTEDEMWLLIRGKARNMIKKATKDGIVAEQGIHHLEEFYEMYSHRMIQKGVRIHSLAYFENIVKYLGNQTQFFIAKKAGETIGGMLLVYGKDTGAYVFGGSLVGRGTSPNQLLLWEMIQFSIKKGIKNLDLGESAAGSGVYNFKVWFGGTPRDVHYYKYVYEPKQRAKIIHLISLFHGQFLRLTSYALLQYGTPGLKRKAAIWKRQKGPLQ
jgi:hypothetical protein